MFGLVIFPIQSIEIVLTIIRDMGSSFAAARNFIDLFERIPAIDNESSVGQQLDDFRGDITFKTVSFAYPSRPESQILKTLSFSIKPGQRVAFVGTTGCGKSTIAQLLERFYDANQGQVLFDDVDIRHLNILWLRSKMGLVSQEPVLFDLTIAENIAYGQENVSFEMIKEAAIKANIHHFIQQLAEAYDTKVGRKGSQLSGGEKQRIAIARALIRRPEILILDEVTSALDSYNEQILQETISEIQRDNRTKVTIVIAHRLSTVRSCDMIFMFEQGQIIESGTHSDLLKRCGAYYQLYTNGNS